MQGSKVLVAMLGGALLFFAVAALIMPSRYLVAKALRVRTGPEPIFETLIDLESWPEWTIWNRDSDPSIRYAFGGEAGHIGASIAWHSDTYGETQHVITEVDRPRQVSFDLRINPNLPPAIGRITLEPVPAEEGGGTRVIWGMTGDVGDDLVARLKIGVIQRSAARDFEQNLWRLKRRIELQEGVVRELPDGGIEEVQGSEGEAVPAPAATQAPAAGVDAGTL